ncbi:MAG: hypothetical protein DRQ43_11655 [Gammaproteobacteria bacterium]|nr:MAG: hypothetical protein DRQ43_11655 [Gammaproteobacteria bacterium]
MKIVRVALGLAETAEPGNIVTDGFKANYFDRTGAMWFLPQELVDAIESFTPEEAVILEAKKELTITDLLALKTTYHIDDIIKLKENDLL